MKVMNQEDLIISLLLSNTDERSHLSESKFTKYWTKPNPIPHHPFGSCTASTISEWTFEYLKHLNLKEMNWNTVQNQLLKLLKVTDKKCRTMFCPSGTDAEYLASLILLNKSSSPLTNIVIAPNEIGSGSYLAASGLRFSNHTPDGTQGEIENIEFPKIKSNSTIKTISIRNEQGELKKEKEISNHLDSYINDAIQFNHQILIHLVAGTKTNVHIPSLNKINSLTEKYSNQIHVLVDAAQGRFSRKGINSCLEKNWMVMTTASKFFGGPPFSGVILLPRKYHFDFEWNEEMETFFDYDAIFSTKNNFAKIKMKGVILRWYAGIYEMKRYYEIPPNIRQMFLNWFEKEVSEIFQESETLAWTNIPQLEITKRNQMMQPNMTILSFKLRRNKQSNWLNMEELKMIHKNMISPDNRNSYPIHLGQPVLISKNGSIGALRIALGANIIQRMNIEIEKSGSIKSAHTKLQSWLSETKNMLDYNLTNLEKVN